MQLNEGISAMLEELDRQEAELNLQIEEIGRRRGLLAQLETGVVATASAPSGRGRKATSEKSTSTSNGKKTTRMKNDRSLREYVLDALKRHKSGLELSDIVKDCLSHGYKSNVKDVKFAQVVYQNLYSLINKNKQVEKDEKKYKLIGKAA